MKLPVVKHLLLPILLTCLLCIDSYGQKRASIEGTLINSKTKEGIPLCNVYLSGTSYGTLTDKAGKFIIKNLPAGEYTLVISHVAYGNLVKTVNLLSGDKNLGTLKLKENVTDLSSEVTVESSEDKKWKSKFKKLSKFMMGKNFKPREIEYLNPWVAEFKEGKSGVLRPANDFNLQIENRHLGYRNNYLITDFVLSNRLQYVVGYPNFEPMEARDSKEVKKWQKNRKQAYNGSLRHFFKSLIENTLEENDFIANLTDVDPEISRDHYERVINDGNYNKPLDLSKPSVQKLIQIESTDNENIKRITCQSVIEVYHIGTEDQDGESPRSLIKLESSSFLVYSNGVLLNMRSVRLYGFFSQEGLYDMLPFEYDLSK